MESEDLIVDYSEPVLVTGASGFHWSQSSSSFIGLRIY